MSKFSQGQWYVDHFDVVRCDDEYDRSIAYLITLPATKELDDANARLITAAPEMYEKLLDCAEFLEERGMLQCEGCSDFATELLVSVEELLSRIDGEEVNHEEPKV